MFDAGSISSTLELDREPFLAGLRAARLEGQRFQRERFTATINANADTLDAQRKLDEVARDRTVNADFNLDTGEAMAKIELLKREAASIGGGIGGGIGGTGGGGGSSSAGPGLFGVGRGVLLPAALGLGASFLPTLGATAVQGALGAGALGTGLAGAGIVGGAGIASVAAPALKHLSAVTTAEQNLAKAVAVYGKNSTEAKTATQQLQAAQAQLPKSGDAFATSLQNIKDRWAQLSQPAQNQFFGMLNDGLNQANKLMPTFANVAQRDMSAARGAVDHFFASFNTPGFHTFLQTMSATFAVGIGPFERGVENIAHVLERVAIASAPEVIRLLNSFQQFTHGWEQDTRNGAQLGREIHGYVQDFRAWGDLAGGLGKVLSALFITNHQGAKTGRQELEAMTRTLDHWASWINHHHHDINQFFSKLNDDFGLLLGSAGNIASVVLPAFKPVGDIIHTIVSDLNSLKVGNVSALTVLLGIMAGRGIAGRLGLVGAGAGAAGGVSAGEAAAAGGGGGVGVGALAGRAGTFLLDHPMAGPTAAGALAAVAFQSLAGKPGTFLGPGVAGLVPKAGQFTHDIRQDLQIQQTFHHKSLAQLEQLRSQAQAQWRGLWETDPQTAQSAGAEAMKRTARDTAQQISAQIRAEKIGQAFADSVSAGGPALKRQLAKVGNAFDDMSTAQQNAAIKAAKQEMDQLHAMGLITLKQERQGLNALEDAQAKSQQDQRQKWNQFGLTVNKLIAGWFGGMTNTVNTLLGNKGITGMVNQLLTGVASQHKLKWNATTVGRVAGQLAGDLGIGGGQRGGMTGGWSSFDDRMVPLRGNEAILRGEDHVPIVSRALQSTYGFGLGDLFSRTGASNSVGGRARGGYAYPFSKSMALGRVDEGVDAAVPGAPIGALGNAVVTSNINAFAPSYGSSNQGMVYKLLGGPPKGYEPSSPYVYVYEGLDKVAFGSHLKAGQLLGHIHASYPGIEMGWAAGPSGPALAAGHYSEGQQTAEGQSFMRLLRDLAHGKAVSGGGGIGSIPRIVVKGPPGAARDALQGIADRGRHAANAYLAKQAAPAGGLMGGGHSVKVPAGSLSLPEIGRLTKAHGGPPILQYVAWNESGGDPHAVSSAGAQGLWQFLPSTWAGLGVPGSPFDPNAAAAGAHKLYAQQGLTPWSPSAYAGAHGGWHQDLGKGYTLRGGGMIPPGAWGMVHPPEMLVPGGSHGTGVLSQADTLQLLRKAARGPASGGGRTVVVRPQFDVHVHAHPGSGADLLQDEITAGIETYMEESADLNHALAGMNR